MSAASDLHIAIVGAGIAGLSLAIGLHNRNISFTLYEEAARYSTVGAGIGLGPNGLLAMDRLEAGFRPHYEAVCVGNKLPKDQNVFFEGLLCEDGLGLNESWYSRSSWGATNYVRKSAHRRELLDIMTSFIPKDRVQFSKRLTRIDQHDDHVNLHFADRSVAQASALIGADGVQSIVREHVLRPLHSDQIRPKYASSYAYRAVIPMPDAREILGNLTDTAKMYIGKDRLVVTYRVSGGAEFNFLHCVCKPSDTWPFPDQVTQEVSHETMRADFANRGIDQRLLQLLEKAPPVRWGLFHHIETSTYCRDHVAVIGDSAYASLPHQAAGAGQGVEDALLLTTTLETLHHSGAQIDQLPVALQVYDEIRRPRAQRQTEQSLETAGLLCFQDPGAGDDMEKTLKRLQNGRFDWLWFHDLDDDVRRAQNRMRERLAGAGHIVGT